MKPAIAASRSDAVRQLWPELDWIVDSDLRAKTTRTWERAFELSPLKPEDLERIPFTLLIPNCPTTFMEHKRCVVHIARRAAEARYLPASPSAVRPSPAAHCSWLAPSTSAFRGIDSPTAASRSAIA